MVAFAKSYTSRRKNVPNDPFGNMIAQSGTEADDNPFRFSIKSYDEETGLSYYGYRYYSAGLGRWLSRDPMEEIQALLILQSVGSVVPDVLLNWGQMEYLGYGSNQTTYKN